MSTSKQADSEKWLPKEIRMPPFEGTRTDPITGQRISNNCWNGWHEFAGPNYLTCDLADCECLCHLNSYHPDTRTNDAEDEP